MPLTVESVDGRAAEKGLKAGWDLVGIDNVAVDDAPSFEEAYLAFRKKAFELPTQALKVVFVYKGIEKSVDLSQQPLGFNVDPNSDPLRVTEVDNVAASKGIKVGMLITEIDGRKMDEFTSSEALAFLNSEAASLTSRVQGPTTYITTRILVPLFILFLLVFIIICIILYWFFRPRGTAGYLEVGQDQPLLDSTRKIAAPKAAPHAAPPAASVHRPLLQVVFSDGGHEHTVTYYDRPLGFRMYRERYPVAVSSIKSTECIEKGVRVGMNVIKVAGKRTEQMTFQQVHDLLLTESAILPLKPTH